jgi:hypothetical protein
MPLKKLRYKIVSWLLIVAVGSAISFIIYGYHLASATITYLPDIKSYNIVYQTSGTNQTELRGPWFILVADESGRISVKNRDGGIIISSLTYYSSCDSIEENWGLKDVSVKLINDSTITVTGTGSSGVLVREELTIHTNTPKLDVLIKTNYNRHTLVQREALIAKYDVPVSEVYLKNRKTDVGDFDHEYWLQRQGVRFGSGSMSSLIYNSPDISSLQLDAERNLLFINLDFFLDHPHIYIPYQKNGGGKWINQSSSDYSPGSERENSFSVYFGDLPNTTPRLMLVPGGYIAGYVFTEHADGGNLRTHRAAYFGAENISDLNKATGGFAGHRIPVTKSVFLVDSTEAISGSPDIKDPDKLQFLDFLNQLYASGLYDICLHTPEDYNSNRESLIECVKFMKEKFDTKTWIDHGMYNGTANRESFVCDGLKSGSEYFAADLWEKYDTRYFWNPSSELIGNSLISPSKSLKEGKFFKAYVDLWKHYFSPEELKEMKFPAALKELLRRHYNKGELNSLLPDKGSAYPTPLYWQHPTRTGQFYSWTTDYVKDYGRLTTGKSEKQFYNEQIQLNQLLTNWGIFINHGYYVRNREEHNIFSEEDGKIFINPYFDKILGLMAGMRDDGDLFITTIRNLLDYWILIENVSFEYMSDGRINVLNLNNEDIKGLSLAVQAETVLVDDEIPKNKRIGEDTIFWFDIPAKGKIILRVGM